MTELKTIIKVELDKNLRELVVRKLRYEMNMLGGLH